VSFLIDTNVLSELRKGQRCDVGVAAWFDEVTDEELFVSVLTIGEIRRGVELIRRRDTVAAARLGAWLEALVTSYSDRIVSIDATIAERWGRMSASDPVPVVDGLLAATAWERGLTLVTRNVADVAATGVNCINPFSSLPGA
jgi:predicted nucleic acid-binding protein